MLKKNPAPRVIWVLLVFLQIGAVNLWAAERSKEVIAFGDSITQGYPEIEQPPRGQRVGGYEPDLEILTAARNDRYSVFNYGVGGETTLTGIQRFDWVMSMHPSARNVLILEGTNDIWSQISREDTVWHLSLMIDKARNFGIEPVLGTLTPDPRSGPGEYKNVPKYNTMIREMAGKKQVALAELYNEMVDDWISVYTDDDLLHPNRAGYVKMAKIWFKTVFPCSKEYLDQCLTESQCKGSGGYWYADECNKYPASMNSIMYLLLNTP